MRLTQRQQATRSAIERQAASALAPICLSEAIGAALSLALPSDGYRLFGIDPATTLVNRLLAASESDGWARREWLRDVYLAADQIPYVELPMLMRLRLPVVASQPRQSACWGYPADVLGVLSEDEHERAFHEIGSPEGGTILASFASRGSWVAALQLYRRDPATPFLRSDVAFLRSLASLIGESLGTAFVREQALNAGDYADDASGIVLFRSDGTGSDNAVAIVMTRQRPVARPEIPANWPLTPQERQISGLLAQGMTNRAISEALFVSENTIQTHLRHIYSKLEVTGRTQLLARLFRESAGVHLFDEGAA